MQPNNGLSLFLWTLLMKLLAVTSFNNDTNFGRCLGIVCDSYTCMPHSQICDGIYNCEDGTDEKDCFTCDSDHFLCNNGECIPGNLQCDGSEDCDDSSDEWPETCGGDGSGYGEGSGQSCYQCKNGECIPPDFFCNGVVDCQDSSDEPQGCPHQHVITNRVNFATRRATVDPLVRISLIILLISYRSLLS